MVSKDVGRQSTSPASQRRPTSSAPATDPSMMASRMPSAMRPRDRPNHAPRMRPRPTIVSPVATYAENGIRVSARSVRVNSPMAITITEKVSRNSRDRGGLGGFGGFGGFPAGTGGTYGGTGGGPYGAPGGGA